LETNEKLHDMSLTASAVCAIAGDAAAGIKAIETTRVVIAPLRV